MGRANTSAKAPHNGVWCIEWSGKGVRWFLSLRVHGTRPAGVHRDAFFFLSLEMWSQS